MKGRKHIWQQERPASAYYERVHAPLLLGQPVVAAGASHMSLSRWHRKRQLNAAMAEVDIGQTHAVAASQTRTVSTETDPHKSLLIGKELANQKEAIQLLFWCGLHVRMFAMISQHGP